MAKPKPELHSMRCLRAAIAYCGGREKLAEDLGLTRFAIDTWLRDKRVSPRYVKELVLLTENKFQADELLGIKD